jgi:hypothetical protein
MRNYHPILVHLFSLAILASSCQPTRTESLLSVDLLVQDVRFSIGGRVVRLPLAAVSWSGDAMVHLCKPEDSSDVNVKRCLPSLDELAQQSRIDSRPIIAEWLRVTMRPYNQPVNLRYYDDGKKFINCDELHQKWVQLVCRQDPTGGGDDAMKWLYLQEIQLVKIKDLEDPGFGFVKDEGRHYGSQEILFFRARNQNSCPYQINYGAESQSIGGCYAALKIDGDVVALWDRPFGDVPPDHLDKQAQFVRAFLDFGIGETENFPALKATMNNEKN